MVGECICTRTNYCNLAVEEVHDAAAEGREGFAGDHGYGSVLSSSRIPLDLIQHVFTYGMHVIHRTCSLCGNIHAPLYYGSLAHLRTSKILFLKSNRIWYHVTLQTPACTSLHITRTRALCSRSVYGAASRYVSLAVVCCSSPVEM